MAFGVPVGTAFVNVLPKTDSFVSGLVSQVRTAITKASGSVDASPLMTAVNTSVLALGAVAVGAIYKGIQATQQWTTEVTALQRVTGQTITDTSRLAGAAKLMGVSTSQLSTSFTILSSKVATNSTALAKYGIVTRDTTGTQLPLVEILGNIQEKFTQLPEGAQRTAMATALFGRAGRNLIPILGLTADQMDALMKKAEDLGLVLSEEDAVAAKQLTAAQRELGAAFQGLSMTLGKSFIPILTAMTKGLVLVVEVIQKIPQPVIDVTLGILALNAAVAVGKGVWSILAHQLELATAVLGQNTAATVVNTGANEVGAATALQTGEAVEKTAQAIEAQTTAEVANTGATVVNATANEAAAAATALNATSVDALLIAETRLIPVQTLVSAGTGIMAKVATLLNSTLVATLAPLYGFYEGLQAARMELDAFQHQDAAGVWNAMSRGARLLGITLPPVEDKAKGLREGIDSITEGLKDGSLSADAAIRQMQILGNTYGFEVTPALMEDIKAQEVELKTLEELTAEQVRATAVATLHANKIHDLANSSNVLTHYLDEMGMSTKEFEAAAKDAFRTGEFDAWAADFRETAIGVWDEFQSAAYSSLNFTEQTVADLGTNLKEGASLTAQGILNQFQNAKAQTGNFARDLLEISDIGGRAAKDLASALLASGNVMAAQVIADAPGKLQTQIVRSFGAGETAADNLSRRLTNAIVGPLNAIQGILEAIARKWGITVDMNGNALGNALDLQATIQWLLAPGHTPTGTKTTKSGTGVYNPFPKNPDLALGGIVRGAAGFITGGPTYLTGEGHYATPAGPGAEAVIPLNARGRDFVRDAWGMGGGGRAHLSGELRISDWRTGIASLDGEQAWEDAVRTR